MQAHLDRKCWAFLSETSSLQLYSYFSGHFEGCIQVQLQRTLAHVPAVKHHHRAEVSSPKSVVLFGLPTTVRETSLWASVTVQMFVFIWNKSPAWACGREEATRRFVQGPNYQIWSNKLTLNGRLQAEWMKKKSLVQEFKWCDKMSYCGEYATNPVKSVQPVTCLFCFHRRPSC